MDQKGSMAKRYWLIVGSLVAVFAVVVAVVIFAYNVMSGDEGGLATPKPLDSAQSTPSPDTGDAQDDDFSNLPKRVTVMVLGLDETLALADVQLIVTFDTVNHRLDVISVPRDTYVELPRSDVNEIQAAGRFFPDSGVSKLTELNSYAGKELGAKYTKRFYEREFGIEIDYYAVINIKAFRNIVDAVGGIEFNVRSKGYTVNPPDQAINIHIPGGFRRLNGLEAEGIVRYRADYVNGDEGRVAVQQEFMQAFFSQVLERDAVLDSLPVLFTSLVEDVRTDFGLNDLMEYLPLIKTVSGSDVHFHQIPGAGQYVGIVSYFLIDDEAAADMIAELFFNVGVPNAPESSESTVPEELKIQVLNGGATIGAAGRLSEELEDEGYHVVETGDYDGAPKNYTRILVRNEENGALFEDRFRSARVEIDSALPAAYDVVIILGQGE